LQASVSSGVAPVQGADDAQVGRVPEITFATIRELESTVASHISLADRAERRLAMKFAVSAAPSGDHLKLEA